MSTIEENYSAMARDMATEMDEFVADDDLCDILAGLARALRRHAGTGMLDQDDATIIVTIASKLDKLSSHDAAGL